MSNVGELAELRRLFMATSTRMLRTILMVAWLQRRVRPQSRRDEGLQQRLSLVRRLIRERR